MRIAAWAATGHEGWAVFRAIRAIRADAAQKVMVGKSGSTHARTRDARSWPKNEPAPWEGEGNKDTVASVPPRII